MLSQQGNRREQGIDYNILHERHGKAGAAMGQTEFVLSASI
jgi:hypothetical protein